MRFQVDKVKRKFDEDHTSRGKGPSGEILVDNKLASYTAKSKQLTSKYLCATLSHILASLVFDLGEQVRKLLIS